MDTQMDTGSRLHGLECHRPGAGEDDPKRCCTSGREDGAQAPRAAFPMFNSSVTGTTDGEGLATFVRDAGERIVAVICGHTWGGYCETREFWPEESHRGRDLGTRLP